MNFNVSKEVLDLGMNVAIVVIKDMKNKKESQEFNIYKNEVLSKIKMDLSEENINNDKILNGFWKLHEKIKVKKLLR